MQGIMHESLPRVPADGSLRVAFRKRRGWSNSEGEEIYGMCSACLLLIHERNREKHIRCETTIGANTVNT